MRETHRGPRGELTPNRAHYSPVAADSWTDSDPKGSRNRTSGATLATISSSDNSAAFSVQIDPNGVVVTTQQAPTTLPLAADGGGDVLLEPVGQPPSAPGVFVRPAGGGSDQPGPAPLGQEEGWAVAPAGRVIALIWASDNTTLELSVWLP